MTLFDIRESAVRLLLGRRFHRLPVDPEALCKGEIRCDTMGSFCSKTKMTRRDLTQQAGTEDGLTLILPRGGYLILYNEQQKNPRRRAFTIAHELGHITLGHLDDQPRQEREANQFAAELLMPRVLIWQLGRQRPLPLSSAEAAQIFGVSVQAAEIRLGKLSLHKQPFSEQEYLLLRRYSGLLSDVS